MPVPGARSLGRALLSISVRDPSLGQNQRAGDGGQTWGSQPFLASCPPTLGGRAIPGWTGRLKAVARTVPYQGLWVSLQDKAGQCPGASWTSGVKQGRTQRGLSSQCQPR